MELTYRQAGLPRLNSQSFVYSMLINHGRFMCLFYFKLRSHGTCLPVRQAS